ncbi:MAG: bifunctional (p)ppGpp synthetase/guanosine-3',5'-bis(diphosphate) 3'-pyrophosphohydrolase [Clostridiales bacterium]|nr:bifunctional (p)ppGpp synthetase/guanosine-3',5'-bis(diphosphate) 3'-pyrophosphohydrolase [Clostridiales bacterium]
MLEKLINKIEQYNPDMDLELVIKAYNYAQQAHEGQKRISGDPYINHPAHVAMILSELELDLNTIVAGLLHDVVEDTDSAMQDIEREFGSEIAQLVDGVTKLGRIWYRTKEEEQAENLRKMFIAMAKDIRVILIKLADRVHNMRTLGYLPEVKRKEKAKETLEIYAPIAHRLGMSKIKWELEDLALRHLDPKGYYELVERVAKKRLEREEYIKEVITELREKLNEMGISGKIEGRPKHFYSIYKKMVYQNKTFEQIFDLTAIRIIVDTIKDCYGVLGTVHAMWKPIPGRFKDYIAMPKPNMYQSLHTTVIGPEGEPLEIQIRTWEMHRISEYGIAAHWMYKEGKKNQDEFDKKLSWLRQFMEWERDTKDAREFMETLKIDLFTDEVFVFTPKGEVIDLPNGSTPIDFAYKIHSGVGNSCVGAKVNGKIVPLEYKLKNGDIVEILTSASSPGPSRDWLKIVKSSSARNRIRQWFKKERREENLEKGKEIFEKGLKRQGYTPSEILRPEWIEKVLKKFGLHNMDDLYATLGYGGLSLNQVLGRFKEEMRKEKAAEERKADIGTVAQDSQQKRERPDPQTGVVVKGITNVMVRFAKCCNPVPGDEIIGYITRGRGVSVHRLDCTNVGEHLEDPHRLIEVEWYTDESKGVSYMTDLQIKAFDRSGLLADITGVVTEAKLPVKAINARANKDNTATINMTLAINDTTQLNQLIKKLKTVESVSEVYRMKG